MVFPANMGMKIIKSIPKIVVVVLYKLLTLKFLKYAISRIIKMYESMIIIEKKRISIFKKYFKAADISKIIKNKKLNTFLYFILNRLFIRYGNKNTRHMSINMNTCLNKNRSEFEKDTENDSTIKKWLKIKTLALIQNSATELWIFLFLVLAMNIFIPAEEKESSILIRSKKKYT